MEKDVKKIRKKLINYPRIPLKNDFKIYNISRQGYKENCDEARRITEFV